MHFWLLLQIYLCCLWLLLCSRDTYVTYIYIEREREREISAVLQDSVFSTVQYSVLQENTTSAFVCLFNYLWNVI